MKTKILLEREDGEKEYATLTDYVFDAGIGELLAVCKKGDGSVEYVKEANRIEVIPWYKRLVGEIL